MPISATRFLYANRLIDGGWRRGQVLLVAPGPVADLATTVWWRPRAPHGSRQPMESLTCTRSRTGRRLIALRQAHGWSRTWAAVTVSGIWLPDGPVPAGLPDSLRDSLRTEPAAVARRCARYRGTPEAEQLTLLQPASLGPGATARTRSDTGEAVIDAAVEALLAGRRVALVGTDEQSCARAVSAVLAGLPDDHEAHSSWSTLECDGLAGLAVMGVVEAHWAGAAPDAMGYVTLTLGEDPASRLLCAGVDHALPDSRVEEPAAVPGQAPCPACGRSTLVESGYRWRAAEGRDLDDPLGLAVGRLRAHTCRACGLQVEHRDCLPVVVLGARDAGAPELVRAALRESMLIPGLAPMMTRGLTQPAGPWRAREVLVHGDQEAVPMLILEAEQLGGWRASLARLAAQAGPGLVVVCVDSVQLPGTPATAGRRPGGLSEARRLLREAAAAVRDNDLWDVAVVVTRAARPAAGPGAVELIRSLGGPSLLAPDGIPAARMRFAATPDADRQPAANDTGAAELLTGWTPRRPST